VTCVLSALDVQLRARREGQRVHLTWAVNERHPEQRFYLMRHTEKESRWETFARLQGDVYSYTDGPLAPGRYLYQVSQELPSGGILFSNAAEAILLPEGAYLMVEQRVRPVGEGARLLWSLPDGDRPNLTLLDAAGRVLYTFQAETPEGSIEIPSPSAAGVYFLQVETRGSLQTLRLLWQ